MTEELFREDATLLACDAVVTAQEEGGVTLDRTVSYPLGGGQAAHSAMTGCTAAMAEVGTSKEF